MRITRFSGLVPKISAKSLPDGHAVVAENLDVYGNHLRPIKLPEHTGEKLLTPCGKVFEGTPRTVHRAGSIYIAWEDRIHTAVDWTRKLGDTTFLFVDEGKLWRQSAERVLLGECPIQVGICRPHDTKITTTIETQAGCEKTNIPFLCIQSKDCDNVKHPPVPVAYLFTYKNACGEESAQSQPSEVMDIEWGDAVVVTVEDPHVPENAISRVWYRAVTDNEGLARWLRVGETPIGQSQFIDTNCPCDFADELMTHEHDCPPDCLEGVTVIGDNVTMLWSGRHFWLSENNFPHAYNTTNEYKLRYPIIGAYEATQMIEGSVHYTVLAITEGLHYLLSAESPNEVNIAEIQQRYKCDNPYSIVHNETGLLYSTKQGLCSLSTDGEKLLTGSFMTEHEWQEFKPQSVRLCYFDDRVYLFHSDGGAILQLGLDQRREPAFVTHDIKVDMAFTDETSKFLLFKGSDIYEYGIGQPATYDWHSKVFTMPGEWRPVICKVVSPDFVRQSGRELQQAEIDFKEFKRTNPYGDVTKFFVMNPQYQQHYVHLIGIKPSVTVIIYADGKEYYRRQVSSNKPFLLPRKYKAIDWSVRLIGSIRVDEVHLQNSREALIGGE